MASNTKEVNTVKKQLLLFPLFALLLTGCGHEEPPSPGGTPEPLWTSVSEPTQGTESFEDTSNPSDSTLESCSCSDEDSSWANDPFDFPPGVKKPIIYFYPEEEIDLTVTFYDEDRLMTTYPKYEGGWNIHLKEDGTFTTGDSDREYYALFFDEVPNYTCNFTEGFYVTKDNAISFLEEKMDYMGFTNRETDEFIMYWLPILESNEKSLVYFEQTEERNEECPLEFSLEPDTLIRTIIHIKKVNEPTFIQEQTLTHYERNGFTVTEWGGIEH